MSDEAATEPIPVVDDTPPAPPSKGHCVICGAPTGDGRKRYCDEHQDQKAHALRAQRQPVKLAQPSPRTVTDRAAAGTVAKLLIVFSLIVMRVAITRRGIADPDGSIADRLAMTDAEATAIAAPIARITNTNPVASRMLGPVVRNEDVLAAVLTVYDYQHRVSSYLNQLQGSGNPPSRPPRPAVQVRRTPARPEPAAPAPEPVEQAPADMAPAEFHAAHAPLVVDERGQLPGGII